VNGYWLGFGGLLMLLFWVVVIDGIFWVVLAPSRRQHAHSSAGGSTALRILEERLAPGEIDSDEFRTWRAAILPVRLLVATRGLRA
jgi:putative membrane protein